MPAKAGIQPFFLHWFFLNWIPANAGTSGRMTSQLRSRARMRAAVVADERAGVRIVGAVALHAVLDTAAAAIVAAAGSGVAATIVAAFDVGRLRVVAAIVRSG